MGITDSPYHPCQAVTWAKSIVLRDRRESDNTFSWYRVVVNITGLEGYNCKIPWVYKERGDGLIAADLFICVDDGLTIGPTEELCWEASRKWGSTCSWLKVQDVSRNVQPPSQAPGTWVGTVTTNKEGFYGLVSQDWRDKTQGLIQEVRRTEEKESDRDGMDISRLDSIRGLLVSALRNYQDMKPYLKGIHITLDSWRPHNDD